MTDKLEAAIAYLRSRKKYILDPGCKFKPTSPAHTDITKTVETYRQEVLLEPKVKIVRKKS